MRTIAKGIEPASLTAHRKTRQSDYGNYAAKDELRNALVREQRGLCCYCMSRIHADPKAMKIEHWRSQRRYRDEQLVYKNLLGACPGGEGERPSAQHCDTRKDKRTLKWNPANPAHRIERRIRFDSDGTIRSDDAEFERQLDEVLGLNLTWLKRNREAKIKGILDWRKGVRSIRDRSRRNRIVAQERSRYLDGDGDLPEYCQVVVHWLDKRLARTTP